MSPDDEILQIPGAEHALLGMVQRCGQAPFLVYDWEKLVEHFMAEGMTDEEAVEWIAVNVEGAWVGNGTPGVVHRHFLADSLD